MSYFIFGLGSGHLPKKAYTIAKKHGATLINYTDPGCSCGHGCRQGCPNNRRHWFVGPNLGEPFDSAMAEAVIADLRAARATN